MCLFSVRQMEKIGPIPGPQVVTAKIPNPYLSLILAMCILSTQSLCLSFGNLRLQTAFVFQTTTWGIHFFLLHLSRVLGLILGIELQG